MARYYRFDHASGGTWPSDLTIQPGAVIRLPRSNSQRPGAVFNAETCEWVSPVWIECDDPREVTP
jgi:hypothetical protein